MNNYILTLTGLFVDKTFLTKGRLSSFLEINYKCHNFIKKSTNRMKVFRIILISLLLFQLLQCKREDLPPVVEISDDNFLNALIEAGIDLNGDGFINQEEAQQTITLDISGQDIRELTGVDAFINLDALDCSDNLLSYLDLSANTRLRFLNCSKNDFNEFDISSNVELKELKCEESNLRSLDVTEMSKLEILFCNGNRITELDLSGNRNLKIIYCAVNQLTHIDFSNNPELEEVDGCVKWMAENLAYLPAVSTFDDGSWLENEPHYYVFGYLGTEVEEAKEYIYTNGVNIYQTYGVLYNYAAAKEACPEGWHIPIRREFLKLLDFLGENAAGKLKDNSNLYWKTPDESITNESGFTALPGASRFEKYWGYYFKLGETCSFWTSTIHNRPSEEITGFSNYTFALQDSPSMYLVSVSSLQFARSVRCVKD